ncbi:PKD domain-containing protein [Ningiella sp. W23]|uniref:carboxylesterase family protein n=1 Tax=Ningiella sp. W23 TaxID=3023715 RepID=UPI0037563775
MMNKPFINLVHVVLFLVLTTPAIASVASENIALNKPARDSQGVLLNITDGDLSNRGRWVPRSFNRPADAEIDLQGSYTLTSVQFSVGLLTDSENKYVPDEIFLQYHNGACWVDIENAHLILDDKSPQTLSIDISTQIVANRLRYRVLDAAKPVTREVQIIGYESDAPVTTSNDCFEGANVVVRTPYYDYARYLPMDYSEDPSRSYPLIVSMHGRGGNTLNQNHTQVLPLNGPFQLEGFHRQLLNMDGQYEAIVVSPNCKSIYQNRRGSCWFQVNTINQLVGQLMSELKVDPERVFLTGLSAGAQTAIKASVSQPDVYAGMAPIAITAVNETHLPGSICQYTNTNVRAYAGELDPSHGPASWYQLINQISQKCSSQSLERFVFEVIPGGRHNGSTWNTAYANHDLQQWFLETQHPRNSDNDSLKVDAGDDFKVNLDDGHFELNASVIGNSSLTYSIQWELLTSPNTITIQNSDSLNPDIIGAIEGEYSFRVSLTDQYERTDSDVVSVTVFAPAINTPPVITMPSELVISSPDTEVSFNLLVQDEDYETSINWVQLSGPSVALVDTLDSQLISISNLVVGTYALQVSATDSENLVSQATLSIIVLPASNGQITNIVIGKPISATSEQNLRNIGVFRAEHAIDGRIGPRDPLWAPGRVSGDRYIEIDLLDRHSLVSAKVFSGFNGRNAIKNFHIESFVDGNWRKIDGASFSNGGSFQTEVNLVFSPNVYGSKLRFVCKDPRIENCRLRELEVYGQAHSFE